MKPFCRKWRSLMLADLDLALEPERREQLLAHLQACTSCREQQRLLAAAQAATTPLRLQRTAALAPADLTAAVMSQIPEASTNPMPAFAASRSVQPVPNMMRMRRYATALATVFLLIALVIVYRSINQTIQQTRQNTVSSGTPTTTALPQQAEAASGKGFDMNAQVAGAGSASIPAASDGVRNSDKSAIAANGQTAAATGSTRAAGSNGSLAPPTVLGYRLYTGSLTDLATLTDQSSAYRLPPQLLADATVMRILTSPADATLPVRQVIILAGYPAGIADNMASLFQAARTADSKIAVETITPENQSRLAAIFGDALYAQLLPTAADRQLTYIMITIGG